MRARLLPEAKMSISEKLTLRRQLDEYYQKVSDYVAFSEASNQSGCWVHIENEIQRLQKNNKAVEILEIGAGRSGFGKWLQTRGLRNKVYWSAQDVTIQNLDWLESQANQVFYNDVSEITSHNNFDIVFSTYVLEHITDPPVHLEYLYGLLRPGGSLFIFCPRYDVPGYLCPSSRHLSWHVRLKFEIRWVLARCRSLWNHQPSFLLQTDLAAFHESYFVDADAIHWVSLLDLKFWAQSKGTRAQQLKIEVTTVSVKEWIVKRLLTCSIRIHKL